MLKVLLWICLLPGLLSSCQRQTGEDTLDILFTGDVLLDRGVRHEIERHGVEGLFEGVSEAFRQADAVVINLECPLTSRHTPVGKKFVFRAEPEWAEGLRRAGVTHAALANNHTTRTGGTGRHLPRPPESRHHAARLRAHRRRTGRSRRDTERKP